MKIRHFLFMLLAAGAWASCSDDGDLAANDSSQEMAEGNAFISLNVVLPTNNSSVSRVGEGTPNNDNFNNGLEAEYSVKDLTILLFDSPEPTGVLKRVYSTKNGSLALPSFGPENSNPSNITTSANVGVMSVADKSDVYAVVIANINANLPSYSPGVTTIAELNQLFKGVNASNFNANGFYMINSPIVDSNNSADILDIIKCTPYETATEATNNASTVHIERILAKVELLKTVDANWSNSEWIYTVPSNKGTRAGDKVNFLAWGLDITNTMSYPIRQIDTDWLNDSKWQLTYTSRTTNRFRGVDNNPQRIYWAIDPNYTSDDESNRIFDKTSCTNSLGVNGTNIDYCLENTFNAANQKQGQTTRVMLKTTYQFKDASLGNIYRTQTYNYMTKNELIARMIDDLKDITGNTSINGINDFKFYTKDYVNPNATYVDKSLKKAKFAEVTVTFSGVGTEPYTYKLGDKNSESGELIGVVERLNSSIGRLDYFKDGESFYYARIKHFGDDVTPWTNNEDYINNELSIKYLGRYGMVRNNWYKLTVNSITNGPGEPIIPGIPGVDPVNPDEPKPGDPVDPNNPDGPFVPEDPTDPTIPGVIPDAQDDEMNYYIDCTINVLSWAVRTQQLDW